MQRGKRHAAGHSTCRIDSEASTPGRHLRLLIDLYGIVVGFRLICGNQRVAKKEERKNISSTIEICGADFRPFLPIKFKLIDGGSPFVTNHDVLSVPLHSAGPADVLVEGDVCERAASFWKLGELEVTRGRGLAVNEEVPTIIIAAVIVRIESWSLIVGWATGGIGKDRNLTVAPTPRPSRLVTARLPVVGSMEQPNAYGETRVLIRRFPPWAYS
jgi:hypothetical protein